MHLEAEPRITVAEAVERLADFARSMSHPVVFSTDIGPDGFAGEIDCFVPPPGQPRTSLPPEAVFSLPENSGAPSVLVVSGTGKVVAEIEPDDVEFTRSLIAAGKRSAIEVLDHVLVSGAGMTRLREATDLWNA